MNAKNGHVKTKGGRHAVPRNSFRHRTSLSSYLCNVGSRIQVPVEKRQVCPGALARTYDIPLAEFRSGYTPAVVTISSAAFACLAARHISYIWSHPLYRPVLIGTLLVSVFFAVQWLLSCRDKPVADSEEWLEALRVTVNVPVFNEAPEILDRTLWALVNQSRSPQLVDVVDDGSAIDYTMLRSHWQGRHGNTEVRWRKKPHAGKKAAQALTFLSDEHADIFVTVDSDSALECRAIENGLKPFNDPEVKSVAGIELALNHRANWVTRTAYSRTTFFQVVLCGAQSVLGDVLVNRGPLAFYRAGLVRSVMPAYLGETFFGRRVKLGDDATLTLFCQLEGKTVQQSDAFTFTAFPETVSHHLRQWIRWMRGSTIRNCWRIRYLPVLSFGWWFTLINMWTWLLSLAVPVAAVASLPHSRYLFAWLIGSQVPWGYLTGLRLLAIRRSDEKLWSRVVMILVYPMSMLWGTLVLRWLRLWGIMTWMKQGWNTRQAGAESLAGAEAGGVR
jgi:hyaluronan synthase